jgi:superfamily I DNA/RNA helicase
MTFNVDRLRAEAIQLQRQVVEHPAPFYVQACPGAGKTRVIIERHIRLGAATGRRGRALVSFTNVACNEIHQRCHEAGRPDLLQFPHFVGTIDTFIWRYLVRPFIPADRYRHRIDSWDRINATVSVTGKRDYKIRLSDFQFRRELDSSTCTARLQQSARTYRVFSALKDEGLLDDAADSAVRARTKYAQQGNVTGHEIRILALHSLSQHASTAISILRTRFDEIVVDEAQDCSNLDLAIIGTLRDAGIPLVFICDPNQAIYEFRGAEPDSVREFGATLGIQVDLTGNWRSSPAICQLASTLRPTKFTRPADTPIGDHHDEPTGILLIPTSDETTVDHAVTVFTTRTEQLSIPSDSQLILAHASNKLPKQSTGGSQPPADPQGARLAWAAAILADPNHTQRQRETAYDIAERTLLRYWYDNTDGHTVDAICEQHRLDRPTFRRSAARFGCALPSVDQGTFGEWCSATNKVLKQHPPSPGFQREGQGGSLQAGTTLKGRSPRSASGAPPANTRGGARVSVIHQVKGEQSEAVLVILPDDDRTDRIINAWITGTHPDDIAENLRVLYVAATRARRLLAIALPETAHDKLREVLRSKAIPLDPMPDSPTEG